MNGTVLRAWLLLTRTRGHRGSLLRAQAAAGAIGRMARGIQTGSRPGAVQIASTLRPTARGFDKGVNPVISVVHSLTAAVIVNNFVMECMMPSKSALNGLLYVSKAWQRAMCEASQLAVNVVFARKLSRSHYA